jgi:hypothetical protein
MRSTTRTHVSTLRFAKEKTIKELKENKHRTMSALFRDIRKMDSVDGIGDWPIMSMLMQEVYKFRDISQKQIWLMCHQSKEYNELSAGGKRRFSDSLFESVNY